MTDSLTPQRFCMNCGAPVPEGAHFCPHCGQSVGSQEIARSDPPPPLAVPAATVSPPVEIAETTPPVHEKSNRTRVIILAAIVSAVVLAVVAALIETSGGGASSKNGDSAAKGAAAYKACQSQVGAFLSTLHDLDSRLDVGLTETQYISRLGDIQVAYDAIDVKGESDGCLVSVGVPAEKAFNTYTKAGRYWRRCIFGVDCPNSTMRAQLQVYWAKASNQLSNATRGLSALKTT